MSRHQLEAVRAAIGPGVRRSAAQPAARATSLVLAAALLLLAAACSSAEPEGAAPPPDTGGGGEGGGNAACVDLLATSPCRAERAGNGCGPDEVCTLEQVRTCGEAPCCTLPTSCRRALPARKPGGFLCEDDDACRSEVCVPIGGAGLCLRTCELPPADPTCPVGQVCALVALDAQRSVATCVSGEVGAYDPAASLCAADSDCAEGRYCRVQDGERIRLGEAVGRCVVGARSGETGRPCEAAGTLSFPSRLEGGAENSFACPETGLCQIACLGGGPEICNCGGATPALSCPAARCTQPCRIDAECPSPMKCRASEHIDPRLDLTYPDLTFSYCQLPDFTSTDWACYDESDCCEGFAQRGGQPCCDLFGGECARPPDERTTCVVAVTDAHYTSECAVPVGLAILGSPCAAASECESGLCADGRCTSPCDPVLAGRCEALLPGSSCCGLPVGAACVAACRTICGGPDGCTP